MNALVDRPIIVWSIQSTWFLLSKGAEVSSSSFLPPRALIHIGMEGTFGVLWGYADGTGYNIAGSPSDGRGAMRAGI